MKVIFFHTKREVEIKGGRRAKDIFRELDLIPQSWLIAKNGELITMDEWVEDGDTVLIIPVVSGGFL